MPPHSMLRVFTAVVRPLTEYACLVWHTALTEQQSDKLESIYTAHAMVLMNYYLNHCTRMCCSLDIVTRCHFTNWPVRSKRGGRNVHFLSINLISFHRSCGIVLVMASLAREMDSAGRQ